MKEKQFISWSKIRKKGRFKYILFWCIYYCILINVIISVADVLRHSFKFEIITLIMRTVFCGVVGIYCGAMTWRGMEIKYFNYIKEQNVN
jgi:hypothetical protein